MPPDKGAQAQRICLVVTSGALVLAEFCSTSAQHVFQMEGQGKANGIHNNFLSRKLEQSSMGREKEHTLANCKECVLAYHEQQQSFPGPTFLPVESLGKHAS